MYCSERSISSGPAFGPRTTSVIFFADEGGSWQVGVDWAKVLPVWFKVFSATAEPQEYAERIKAMVSCHYSYGRDKMLAIARRTATADQRKALAEVKGA